MFVDASAIVALIDEEPGYEEIEKRLRAATGPFYVSPLVRFEATIGLARKKSASGKKSEKLFATMITQSRATVDQFIGELGAEDVDISREIGGGAIAACAKYGKAVGHPANLNFGDCFAYACAKIRGVDLIYKGNDFTLTDLA
ncbi:MAG: type II toxin-antitoxin system VapC family toxin [Parvularculaceae bacterium]